MTTGGPGDNRGSLCRRLKGCQAVEVEVVVVFVVAVVDVERLLHELLARFLP